MNVRIGMGQMVVIGGDWDGNLSRAEGMIAEAASANCDIVVLPECLDLGWTHPSAASCGAPLPGPSSERLAIAARLHGIYVVAGLTELTEQHVYNAAVLLDPDGALLLTHRKINELDIGQSLYATGDRLSVTETPWGRVGLLICADNFPETNILGKSLARMGARIVLSPCAWAVPADYDPVATPYGDLWRDAYQRLARDEGLVTVGVSNVGILESGPWAGRVCIGSSLAIGSEGQELAQAPYGVDAAGLYTVDVSL